MITVGRDTVPSGGRDEEREREMSEDQKEKKWAFIVEIPLKS